MCGGDGDEGEGGGCSGINQVRTNYACPCDYSRVAAVHTEFSAGSATDVSRN